jgi:PAS domain S-box-containing protein
LGDTRAVRVWTQHPLRPRSDPHATSLPPPGVLRAYAEHRARTQQWCLPYWGFGLLLVSTGRWGLDHWARPASDHAFALQLATQVMIVLLAIWLTRGPVLNPARVPRFAIGMLLAMIVLEAIYHAWLPDPNDSFSLLLICYLLTARLMLSGVAPQLVVSAACVIAQVVVLTVVGFPLSVVVAHAAVLAVVSGLLLVGVAGMRQDGLERLYRRRMNKVAFAVASRPTTQTTDVNSAIGELTALAGQTLEVSRVEVWLPDEQRTVMRWIDGYDCAAGDHPERPDIQLRDHPAYLSGLDREPLVQSYELPAPPSAPVCPHVDGGGLASVLEADVRVRGRNGVLCFQHHGRRSWTHDEERFASYLAHLAALAIEAWERHRAEAVLQASERRYRQLFDNAAEVIYAHELDGRLTWVNRAAEDTTGYRRDEMLGMNILDLVAPEDRAETRDVLDRAARGEPVPSPYEFDVITRDGGRVTLEVSWRPVTRDGKPVALQAIAHNLTQRKHAEAELRQACAALEHRGAELSRTVAVLNEHIIERRNGEAQLRASQAQLRALSTRLLCAQEQERRRIAREIHDDLGQALTALRLDVAWLGRRVEAAAPATREKLARMGQLVDATVESVQAIARDLRPPILDDVGIAAAIEWQAKEFERHTGISCRVRLSRDDIELDADRSIALFRLVQEALTNVARHAYATRVTIALTEMGDTLLIVVRDNGRGMARNVELRTGALGLLGMRERIHLCGGRLRIRSRPGKGTVVRAQIPLLETTAHVTGRPG